jgi:hypothetical protein
MMAQTVKWKVVVLVLVVAAAVVAVVAVVDLCVVRKVDQSGCRCH